MTPEEFQLQRQRVRTAENIRAQLEHAEHLLKNVQGSTAVEQHEDVAEALVEPSPWPRLDGMGVYANAAWRQVVTDERLPVEVQKCLAEACRAWVRELRRQLAEV